MGLSNELISQFAKITNDKSTSRVEEVVLYGEVVKCDDTVCVRFDGSDELTPVTTITEKDEDGNITNFKYGAASVKTGDRVSVLLKNHSATITGNLSDPPMGRAEVIINDESIIAKVGEEVNVKIDALGVKVNGLTEFTNGLSNGTTTIDGGCITTGTINAERINFTNLFKYQYSVDGVNDWHDTMTSSDVYRRESIDGGTTWGEPYKFVGKDGQNGTNGSSASVTYANILKALQKAYGTKETFITADELGSPVIYGGEIYGASFYGNEFSVYPTGGELGLAMYDSSGDIVFAIKHNNMGLSGHYTVLYSLACDLAFGRASDDSNILFYGNVDFSNASVTGLTATFA